MPRKPTKKSPKPLRSTAKRMKTFKAFAVLDGDGDPVVIRLNRTSAKKLVDPSDPRERVVCVLVTELPTPTDSQTRDEGRKLEEVRKLCKSYIAYAKSICMEEYQQGYKSALVEVLDILNSTPAAKGGRK